MELKSLFDREVEVSDGTSLTISQQMVGDEATVVWDAALVLCGYIKRLAEKKNCLKGKKAVDIGSGTGLCGLYASAFG